MRPAREDEPFGIDGGRSNGATRCGRILRAGPPRHHSAGLTVLDWLQQFDPTPGTKNCAVCSARCCSRDEGMKPTEALSGGEAARLIFCKLMLQKPNVLVLDEPTNHLDLESINALNIALQKYDGNPVPGHARPRSAGRSGDANLAFRRQRHRRFQGRVRGIPDHNRVAFRFLTVRLHRKITRFYLFGRAAEDQTGVR